MRSPVDPHAVPDAPRGTGELDEAEEQRRILDLAYEVHREYLDADSATSGPIEDYIAKALEAAEARGLERGKKEAARANPAVQSREIEREPASGPQGQQ